MASPFTPFQSFLAASFNGVHSLATADLSLLLSNVEPDPAGSTVLADIDVNAASGGYLATGFPITVLSSAQVDGYYELILEAFNFTATDVVDTWQYAVLVNYSALGQALIGYYTLPAEVDMITDDIFAFNFPDTEGVIQAEFIV